MTDFAKIVTASDGEQVLYYLNNGDDGPELVAMTNIHGITLRIGFGYPDDADGEAKRNASLASMNGDTADAFRRQAAAMVGA